MLKRRSNSTISWPLPFFHHPQPQLPNTTRSELLPYRDLDQDITTPNVHPLHPYSRQEGAPRTCPPRLSRSFPRRQPQRPITGKLSRDRPKHCDSDDQRSTGRIGQRQQSLHTPDSFAPSRDYSDPHHLYERDRYTAPNYHPHLQHSDGSS